MTVGKDKCTKLEHPAFLSKTAQAGGETDYMKKTHILAFALFIFVALSSNVLAGDYAHFHFIGFSRGGAYLAFEEYGINDELEDSSPYSVIYIVNVAQNRYAVSPFKTNGDVSPYDENGKYDADEIETEVRIRNLRRARRELRRYGIIDGNTGLQVAAHLINEYATNYDEPASPAEAPAPTPETLEANANTSVANANSNSSANQNTAGIKSNVSKEPREEEKPDPMERYVSYLPQQVSFTKRGNALYRDGFFQIKLKPVPVTQKNCDQYERDMFSFEMTLINEARETVTLQKAGPVPKNRGCTDGYGIQEAFVYHNKLVVFVGIFTRGWEGENLRLMAVTGELND